MNIQNEQCEVFYSAVYQSAQNKRYSINIPFVILSPLLNRGESLLEFSCLSSFGQQRQLQFNLSTLTIIIITRPLMIDV